LPRKGKGNDPVHDSKDVNYLVVMRMRGKIIVMIWIIPANERYYDHVGSFKKNGAVDWAQQANYQVGDIVYMYVTAPTSKVSYKLLVKKINIPLNEAIDDSEFWKNPSFFQKRKNHLLVRLVPLSSNPNNVITMTTLLQCGVRGQIQRPRQIESNQVLLSILGKAFDSNYLVDFPDDVVQEFFTEGKAIEVFVNKYERNQDAREACIAQKGCICSICGFDFEKTYGTLGRNFIHVHHIVPLNEIKNDYVVNPAKDLIPVCPNCHAMLHRKKEDGSFPSVEELKKLFGSR
jgi:Predicted restriction endonuclease